MVFLRVEFRHLPSASWVMCGIGQGKRDGQGYHAPTYLAAVNGMAAMRHDPKNRFSVCHWPRESGSSASSGILVARRGVWENVPLHPGRIPRKSA